MKIGDKVGFKVDYVNGGDQVVGTVEDIYDNIGKKIVIVKDREKTLHKVREEDVIVFSEEPVEVESSEENNSSDNMITISRTDFKAICNAVTDPDMFDTQLLHAICISTIGTIICRRLEKALFDGGDR